MIYVFLADTLGSKMAVIATFYLARYLLNHFSNTFFWGKKWFDELKNNKTVKLAQFFYIMGRMKLRRVNRYLTCHALKLRTLMEWRQTSLLKNLHRRRFETFYRLPV